MVSVDVGQLNVYQQQHLRGKILHTLSQKEVKLHKCTGRLHLSPSVYHTHTHPHTHLIFGPAVSLPDVGGDDSLGLFSKSRVGSQLWTHTQKTCTCTAAGTAITGHTPMQAYTTLQTLRILRSSYTQSLTVNIQYKHKYEARHLTPRLRRHALTTSVSS